MLYDYRQESKTPMLLTLANGKTIEGEFIDLRIDTNTLQMVSSQAQHLTALSSAKSSHA